MLSGRKIGAVIAGLAATFALLSRRTRRAEGALMADQVRTFVTNIVNVFDLNVSPKMIVRIAWIESGFNPSALRFEVRLGDASAGLMQTLLSTAKWLARDMGYSAFGLPTLDSLLQAQTSIYFGAAYLEYLSRWRGERRSEEWIVRSYNGGPGHSRDATDEYWRRYLNAKERFG